MWESLRRMMEDFYLLFALDKAWWQKLIDRLLDPEVPIPTRPNNGFAYNPRCSRCNTSLDSPNNAHLRIMCLHQDAFEIVVTATDQGLREMRSQLNQTADDLGDQRTLEMSCKILWRYLISVIQQHILKWRLVTDPLPQDITLKSIPY